jgi:RND superfamily putative drug exporter
VLITVAAGVFGVPVASSLCACGFEDPTSESAAATALLANEFDQSDAQLLVTVSSPDGYGGDAASACSCCCSC